MTTLELIGYGGRLEAVVLLGPIEPSLSKALYELLPTDARLAPELSKRWKVYGVMCSPDWEHEQLHRVPMLPVRGIRLLVAEPLPEKPRTPTGPRSWRNNVWRGR